jgi:hypothetical protein
MADLNDLNQPTLTSSANNEVLETFRGHIVRLWKGDYTGMGNLVTGIRRWVRVGTTDVKLVERNAGGTEDTLYDSSFRALKTGTNASGTWPIAISGNAATASTASALTSAAIIEVLKIAYPIGHIYTSTVATNPATLFGFGTWVQFAAGLVEIGAGGAYPAGSTGGSADAIVVSHTHTATSSVSDPGHTHSYPTGGLNNGSGAHADAPFRNFANTQPSGTGISVSTTVASAGASGTGKNLPPYVVDYKWRRTA